MDNLYNVVCDELTLEEDGSLWWNNTKSGRDMNKRAGSIEEFGYRSIGINGKRYKEHRIVWLITYGELPDKSIDHINGVRDDNRPKNLRLVSTVENAKNQKKPSNNTSGCLGVSWKKNQKRWYATIAVDGKNKHLGSFTSYSEAVDSRKNAEVLYGYHENHGREQ